jgi:hypothetical protein
MAFPASSLLPRLPHCHHQAPARYVDLDAARSHCKQAEDGGNDKVDGNGESVDVFFGLLEVASMAMMAHDILQYRIRY